VPALDADPDEFSRIFEVNVKGVWLGVRTAVPAMRRAGGGAIVITGSVMGERARPGFGAYASSKAAANHLAKILALALAPDAIRVNCLAPVATDTPMLPHFLGKGDSERTRAPFVAGIPLGRLAQPVEIADAALFLASDAARFLTGVVLRSTAAAPSKRAPNHVSACPEQVATIRGDLFSLPGLSFPAPLGGLTCLGGRFRGLLDRRVC
jgi:3-oxoacyl-[acyl-carrier protein] reductase